MKYNYDTSMQITDIKGNSFLILDNIYDTLHEYNKKGESVYIYYLGMYFKSDAAENENDRNNMYLKGFGMSRNAYIEYKLEEIREKLIKLGSKYIKEDFSKWESFVNDYMDHIWEYPYSDPVGLMEIYLKTILKSKEKDINMLIAGMYAYGEDIILKGVGILLEDHPAKYIIDEVLIDPRN